MFELKTCWITHGPNLSRRAGLGLALWMLAAMAAGAQTVPRIESVVPLDPQPLEGDPAVIWYDDFDEDLRYGEESGPLVDAEAFGGVGQSKLQRYPKGSRGEGGCKVFFGDSPTGNPIVKRGRKYTDVYWRLYVKHQAGWQGGGPAKLSRATSLASSNWTQAMIAHVWSSGETLTLDPASGVRGGRVATERYNDFPNLRWLGNKPAAELQLFSKSESGWWVCVEARAKLNAPGERDGVNQLWLDGRLEAERTGLDWMGSYTGHGINAVFLEAYWNEGSPVEQSRWLDHFVISADPIGPVVCPRNPVLIKTPFRGSGQPGAWEAEVALNGDDDAVAWRSNPIVGGLNARVDKEHGRFVNGHGGLDGLQPGAVYYARVREANRAGEWSEWSGWHQAFKTEGETARVGHWRDFGSG